MAKYKVDTDHGSYIVETEDAPVAPPPDPNTGKYGYGGYHSNLPWPLNKVDEATSDTVNAMSEGAKKLFGSGKTTDERLGGASEMGRGLLNTVGAPLLVEGGVTAPIRTAVGVGTGLAAQKLGEATAKGFGAGPGTSQFVGDATGLAAGVGAAHTVDPLINTAKVALQPEVWRAGVKILPKGGALVDAIDKFQAAKARLTAAVTPTAEMLQQPTAAQPRGVNVPVRPPLAPKETSQTTQIPAAKADAGVTTGGVGVPLRPPLSGAQTELQVLFDKARAAAEAAPEAAAALPPDVLAELTRDSEVPTTAGSSQEEPAPNPAGPAPVVAPQPAVPVSGTPVTAPPQFPARNGSVPQQMPAAIAPETPTAQMLQQPTAGPEGLGAKLRPGDTIQWHDPIGGGWREGTFVRANGRELHISDIRQQEHPEIIPSSTIDQGQISRVSREPVSAATPTVATEATPQETGATVPTSEETVPNTQHPNHTANAAAQAERVATALRAQGITAEQAANIELGRLSTTQVQQGMIPRWGNLADSLGEKNISENAIPRILTELKRQESAAKPNGVYRVPGFSMGDMKNYFARPETPTAEMAPQPTKVAVPETGTSESPAMPQSEGQLRVVVGKAFKDAGFRDDRAYDLMLRHAYGKTPAELSEISDIAKAVKSVDPKQGELRAMATAVNIDTWDKMQKYASGELGKNEYFSEQAKQYLKAGGREAQQPLSISTTRENTLGTPGNIETQEAELRAKLRAAHSKPPMQPRSNGKRLP